MTTTNEILDNIGGAAVIAGCIVLRPLVQPRYSRWNATDEELRRALPGDERVPAPLTTQTLAVTINAKPESIWPWVAQIGQERGGMYSYELLENVARCKMHNADLVVPEWELTVGDRVRLGPEGYPVWGVVGLERGRWLLVAGADPKTAKVDELPKPGQAQYTNFTSLFYLDEQLDGTTRLLMRNRLDYAPRTFANALLWKWMTDPIGFVMTRKMLLTIKQRVEDHRFD